MLEIKGLTKNFGGLAAINRVDMNVESGEIHGLIGPNGAGKTTFFNLITGYIRPTSGVVLFEGKAITGKSPHYIAGCGIVRTFQHSNIFPNFTVLENVIFACHLKPRVSFMETVFRIGADKKKEAEILQVSQAILEQMGISHLAGVEARALAHGHKRILGIAIAMAAQPKLLLLDEPLSGMNVQEVTETIGIIEKLWKSGLTILLIEHNMRAAMGLCKKITVINFGKKIAEGTPEEIKQNSDVVRAYLGYREHAA